MVTESGVTFDWRLSVDACQAGLPGETAHDVRAEQARAASDCNFLISHSVIRPGRDKSRR